MGEENKRLLLEMLHLPADTQRAIYHTRYNDILCGLSTRDEEIARRHHSSDGEEEHGWGRFRNGIDVRRLDADNLFAMESWTIEDGVHTLSFSATLDDCGVVQESSSGNVVNCFAYGFLPVDQGYIDEFLKEIREESPPIRWDEIQRLGGEVKKAKISDEK